MRSPSQSYKQQRNSGSRAKSKPMLANRELKQGEKPPAKSCPKCKESANYLKLFVKRLGVIEELAVSIFGAIVYFYISIFFFSLIFFVPYLVSFAGFKIVKQD